MTDAPSQPERPLPGRVPLLDELPAGHRLQDLVVERVLAAGPASMVYLVREQASGQHHALKEYWPQALAQRLPGGALQLRQPHQPQQAAAFERGLQAFMVEGRLLAAFNHPGVVKVLRHWAADGSAYMLMPLLHGVSLQQWLADLGTPPSESWLRELLTPLIQGLQALHQLPVCHRHVTPGNILLQFDGEAASYLNQRPQPVLLGLGSAQRALASAQGVSAEAESGAAGATSAAAATARFAAIEMLDGDIGVRQGAWTDVYSLCAVLYMAVAGRPPPPAIQRAVRDDRVPARKVGHGRYSGTFLDAIDAGLVVRPEERLQDMVQLARAMSLHAKAAVGAAASAVAPLAGATAARVGRASLQRNNPRWLWPALAGAALLLAATVGALVLR